MSRAPRLATKLALKAIALGARLPGWKAAEDFRQHGRTMDEIRRRKIDLVLDVGANVGFYAKHLRQAGFKGRIMSFEPDPGTFAKLERFAREDQGWDTFNCALGAQRGDLPFHVIKSGDETVLSSILIPLGHDVSAEIRVPVETVRDLLEREGVRDGQRIFLKMDTQGYDLNVFAGAKGVRGIELLQSELSVVPLYAEMPHYTEALTCFEKAGFGLLDLFVVRRDDRGAVVEYDALLARH